MILITTISRYSFNISLETGTIDQVLIIDNEGEEFLSVSRLPDSSLTFTLPDPLIGVTLLAYTRNDSISLAYNVERTSNSTETTAATTSEPAGTGASTASGEAASATKKSNGMRLEAVIGWLIVGFVLSAVYSP